MDVRGDGAQGRSGLGFSVDVPQVGSSTQGSDSKGRKVTRRKSMGSGSRVGGGSSSKKGKFKALSEFKISHLSSLHGAMPSQKMPKQAPNWFMDYKAVFDTLGACRESFKSKFNLKEFLSGNGSYNQLVFALIRLEMACAAGEFSEDQKKTIVSWLDQCLDESPIHWSQLPLVLNPDNKDWDYQSEDQRYIDVAKNNLKLQQKKFNQPSFFLPAWLSSTYINGLPLSYAYLVYYNARNDSAMEGKALTQEGLFEQDPMVYDWLVLFQDEECVLRENELDPVLYQTMAEMLSEPDNIIKHLGGLSKEQKFCWRDIPEVAGMQARIKERTAGEPSSSESQSSPEQAGEVPVPVGLPGSSSMTEVSPQPVATGLKRGRRESEVKLVHSRKQRVSAKRIKQMLTEDFAEEGDSLRWLKPVSRLQVDDSKRNADGRLRELREGEAYRMLTRHEPGLVVETKLSIIEQATLEPWKLGKALLCSIPVSRGIVEPTLKPGPEPNLDVSLNSSDELPLAEELLKVNVPGEWLLGLGLSKYTAGKHYIYNVGRFAIKVMNVLSGIMESDEKVDSGVLKSRLENAYRCVELIKERADNLRDTLVDYLAGGVDFRMRELAMQKQAMCEEARSEISRMKEAVAGIQRVLLEKRDARDGREEWDDLWEGLKKHTDPEVTSMMDLGCTKACFASAKAVRDLEAKGCDVPDPKLEISGEVLARWFDLKKLAALESGQGMYRLGYRETRIVIMDCLPNLVRKYSDNTKIWMDEYARQELDVMAHLLGYLGEYCRRRLLKEEHYRLQISPFSRDQSCFASEETHKLQQGLLLAALEEQVQNLKTSLRSPTDKEVGRELLSRLNKIKAVMEKGETYR